MRGYNAGRTQGLMRHRRVHRSIMGAAFIASVDARDVGIRAEHEEVFGFGDPRGWPGTPEWFRERARRWFAR